MIRVCTATAPEARLPFSRLHDWLFTGGVDLAYVLPMPRHTKRETRFLPLFRMSLTD